MKKLLLGILLVGSATYANAQKSEVSEAKKQWDIFSITGGRSPFAKTMASLNAGLAHTDNAVANEKSKVMPDAWTYRALFASAIAFTDSVNITNSVAKQKIAEEAIEKSKGLDTKGAEKDNLELAKTNIRNAISGRGIRAYNKKDYKTALGSFKQISAMYPNDTSMYLNAGVVARLDSNYQEAITNFKKLIEFNAPDTKSYYSEIISMTLTNLKDTTSALAFLKDASAKYPNDSEFISTETDIYVRQGNIAKSQELLQKLIAKDASKPVYHFLMGNTYYTQAVDLTANRKKLGDKQLKEIDALNVKIMKMVDLSLPFYKKALELDAKYAPALESLKAIYAFKGDTASYNEVKKRLDEIPAKN